MKATYIGFLLLCFIEGCSPVFNCESWLEENIKMKQYSGIVVDKIEIKDCYGAFVLDNLIIKDTISICICGITRVFWENIELEDSIFKPIGSTKIIIYRNADKYLFDFPCCDH